MAVIEKGPDLREQLGVAVNTSSLEASDLREVAVDRVGALGAAALAISSGADLAGLPIAAVQIDVYRRSADMRDIMLDPALPDERDVIAGELAPLLCHIRFGAQYELLPKSIRLYSAWLGHRRLFADLGPEVREKFATRVLHEWLSDVCIPCGGSGKLERTRTGAWIKPRGSMQRNAIFRTCPACDGTRRARPSHGERARWLGVEHTVYNEERWPQRFSAALIWLQSFLTDRAMRALTAQLERGKRRFST